MISLWLVVMVELINFSLRVDDSDDPLRTICLRPWSIRSQVEQILFTYLVKGHDNLTRKEVHVPFAKR